VANYSEKPWLKSYTLGPFKLKQSIDYPEKPLYSLIDEAAEKFPGRDALDYNGSRIKYRELKNLIDRFSNALAGLGVSKGDIVMAVLPTSPHFIISDFAILKAGASLVPCSTYLTSEGIKHQAIESQAETIICMEKYLGKVMEIKDQTKLKNIIVTNYRDYSPDQDSEIKTIEGTLNLRELIRNSEASPPVVDIDPMEDLAILAFTGGATGVPKGVMLTHYQRLSNVYQGLPWMMEPVPSLKGTASTLLAVPMYHSMGHYLMHSCIAWGLKIFLVADPRNVRYAAEIMNEHRPFLVFMVPTQLMRLASPQIEIKRMPVLIMSGSAPLPSDVAERLEAKIKMPVSESYGLTETGPCTHINISGFAKITRFARDTRPGIGLPIPDTSVKIVDPESFSEVETGEVGEIWLKGPQVMKGYWPEPGSGLDDEGWFRSGDMGKMDSDGYFHVVDRIKDMINVSGLKVYSIEVDEVLFKHPAVAGAVTIGVPVPNKPGTEWVKAFIKLKEEVQDGVTEKELIDFTKDKLPSYAVPEQVEFIDEIPLTVTEKLFKRQLRDREIERLGLGFSG
jgi:long-chain acyl-CoA synthetase